MAQVTRKNGATRWPEVHERLERIEAELAGALSPDQQAIDEVYRRRARRLSERPADQQQATTTPVLVVGLGSERYGIELAALSEVFPYRGCTSVPGAPPPLLGVINVRGDIKAVADLRRLLDLPRGEEPTGGYVVMLRELDHELGLRVDSVDEVRQIDSTRLVAPAGAGTIPASRFVKALAADTMMLIDTGAALSSLAPNGHHT